MRLSINDFNAKYDNRVLVTENEKNLDIETAIGTIHDKKLKTRLIEAMNAVKEAVKNVKDSKGQQLKIDRCNHILNKNYSLDADENLQISRLACNIIIKGQSQYKFKKLEISELVFVAKLDEKVINLYSREYFQVPNGTDENGEILITSTTPVETYLTTFNFNGLADDETIEVNELTLKMLFAENETVTKFLEKFNLDLLSKANIKMIEKHSQKDLKKGIKQLIETLNNELKAIDDLKNIRFNYDNFKPHDEQNK